MAQWRHSWGVFVSHCSLKQLYVLWVFWCLNLASVGRTCWSITLCRLAWGSESPSCFFPYWPTFAWQLTNQSHQSMLCVCLYVCVFTHPPAPPPFMDLPKRLSRALPHLHSSQQLGTGLTGSFSPLCMKQRSSSNAEEQPGTQSGFIISCLLSATNVQTAFFWVCTVGRHSPCAGQCWWYVRQYMLTEVRQERGERRRWAALQSCAYIAPAISPLSGWELCLGLVADCFDVKWFHFMWPWGSQTTGTVLVLLSHGQSGLMLATVEYCWLPKGTRGPEADAAVGMKHLLPLNLYFLKSLFYNASIHFLYCSSKKSWRIKAFPACTWKDYKNPLFTCCLLVGNKKNMLVFI